MRALVVACALVGLFVAAAPAARPAALDVSIAAPATLVEDGAAVLVDVTVACAGGSDVLEAFVYVTQDGQQSRFVGIPVRCGGRERTYGVRVPAPDATTFHAGTAAASGYVLVDRRGDVTSVSPSQTLTVG